MDPDDDRDAEPEEAVDTVRSPLQSRHSLVQNMDFSPHPRKARILLRTLNYQLKFPSLKGLISGRERATLANDRKEES